MQANPLFGKIALVTGAGGGLGKQVAMQLLQAGAKVAVLGRTTERLEQLGAKFGDAVLPVQADVSNPDSVRAAFNSIDQHFGELDILINNAAIYSPFLIDEASDEQLQSIVNINLLGTAYCMREAAKRMKPKGSGDIINISSESARNPFPYLTMYAASKAALENLSAGLRNELAPHGIRVMIFRSGTMTGADANASAATWSDAQLAQAMAAWKQSGHLAYAGSGLDTAIMASAVLNALTLPREATTDIIEVRSSQ
jgi:NAD(P)-dependent dehydrogenase (short-subunit alcohol dehydrogenase family)